MLDINSILNGNPKKKSKNKNSFLDSFRGKGNPNPIDRVTKRQKPFLKSKSYRKRFQDWDKDGVINALDCQPRNKRKHAYVNPMASAADVDYYMSKRFQDQDNYPKKVRLYHGTNMDSAKKIKKDGIRSQNTTKNRNFDNIDPKYKNKIYLTQNKQNAMHWSRNTDSDSPPVVVEVDVPFSEYRKGLERYKERSKEDPMVQGESRDELVMDEIPPNQIKRIRPYSKAVIEKETRSEVSFENTHRQSNESRNSTTNFRKLLEEN